MKLYIVALLALFLALFVVSVQTAEAEKEDTASELKKPAEEAPAPAKLPTPPAAAAGEKKEGERLEEGAKKGGKSRSSNKPRNTTPLEMKRAKAKAAQRRAQQKIKNQRHNLQA